MEYCHYLNIKIKYEYQQPKYNDKVQKQKQI